MTLYLGLLSGVSAILYKNENDLPNIRAKVKLDYPTKALLSQTELRGLFVVCDQQTILSYVSISEGYRTDDCYSNYITINSVI